MKAQEFIDLVNGLYIEEFSDIPEDKVKYIGSRFGEQWDIEDTYSIAMNVYECDDGFVGCRGLCHVMNPLIFATHHVLKQGV